MQWINITDKHGFSVRTKTAIAIDERVVNSTVPVTPPRKVPDALDPNADGIATPPSRPLIVLKYCYIPRPVAGGTPLGYINISNNRASLPTTSATAPHSCPCLASCNRICCSWDKAQSSYCRPRELWLICRWGNWLEITINRYVLEGWVICYTNTTIKSANLMGV